MFAFIVYHLLHFTIGVTDASAYEFKQQGDVYSMVVVGFQQPIVSISYVVAMVLLSMHLSHGVSSVFQTLGFNHPKYNKLFSKVGPAIGAFVSLGFISIPAGVLLGIVAL